MEVFESQYFILGGKVEQCEWAIADYTDCQHAVGVSSGTDAPLVSLMAEDIGPGDEDITTPGGTIPDFITHEENGLLVPRNDPEALARAMKRLLKDEQLYERLRKNVLRTRSNFSYDRATAVWNKWPRCLD